MNRLIVFAAAIGLLFTVIVPEAFGAVTYVNCDSENLQDAIDAASPGDTLVIRRTCVGNFEITENLTLIGKWKATLDGGDSGTTLTIVGATVLLKNLTITGGNEEDGGGILNEGGTLTLIACKVKGNTAETGGGMYNEEGGSITIKYSLVTKNTATSGGGGINNDEGEVTIKYSYVSYNETSGGRGGGIRNGGESSNIVKLIGSYVNDNMAPIGGGINNQTDATLEVKGSLVFKNTASSDGGGINNLGNATLSKTLVFSNSPNNCVGLTYSGCL